MLLYYIINFMAFFCRIYTVQLKRNQVALSGGKCMMWQQHKWHLNSYATCK